MASDSLADELDFEDDSPTDQQEDEFYCSVCSDCYDEAKEFIEHINSAEHKKQCDEKLALLIGGDKYCSMCLTKAEPSFEAHCSGSDHNQFFDSLFRSMPNTASPILKIVEVMSPVPMKKLTSKTNQLKKKDISCKMIGLNYIKRKEDAWFCNICLDKFTSVETHCSKAMHAIQCIKICDPDLAYEIKVSANQKGQKKIVSSIISSKVEEIYEKEKDTPEYKRTMMELQGLNPEQVQDETEDCKGVLDQNKQDETEHCVETLDQKKQETSAENVPENEDNAASASASNCESSSACESANTGAEIQPECSEETPTEPTKEPSSSNSQDMGEMVSLFEEEDRSFIPSSEEISESITNSQESAKSDRSRARESTDKTMIVGISHLKLKGRCYYCGLCDVICKSSLQSCKLHMTSNLHRKRMINKFSAHPIPNYLEKLRTRDASLFNKLIRMETMKIEQDERKNETIDDQHKRAGILGIKKVHVLPAPLLNVRGIVPGDESLNLMELAKKWDSESNSTLFKKSSAEASTAGLNKSAISPIQPHIENILVGVKTVTHVRDTNFHCGLCNIKFDVKNKRNDKHHVNGRLHKKKALVAAYGQDVEAYLQHRSKKDGYDALNRIINQACVPLEKEEVESESPASREIRARLLGVKVGQLPLPMIIMFSNAEAFDIKQAIDEWKGGKKSSGPPSKVVTSKVSEKPSSSSVKSIAVKPKPESPVAPDVKMKPTETPAVDPDQDQLAIKNHLDPQSFDQAKVPSKAKPKTGKSPGARNIFDLCKPMPDVSPDKPVFKTIASASSIKNIDIDGLRKSLVDRELGEFVPVAKAKPEEVNPEDVGSKNKRKLSAEEETPKTSLSEEEIKRRKSSENSATEAKKKLAESIKSELGKSAPMLSNNSSAGSSLSTASSVSSNTGARRTYADVNRGRHDHNQNSSNRTNDQGNNSGSNFSNRHNQVAPRRDQTSGNSRPSQQSDQRNMSSRGRNDIRNGPRGNSQRNNDSRDKQTIRDSDAGRNTDGGRDNNRFRGSGRGNFGSRNNREGYNRGGNSGATNNHNRDQVSSRDDNSRRNTNNYGSHRANDPHASNHGNQSSESPRFTKAFNIDDRSMKNTNLSSALAQITNIAPISQACNAKINEVAQNLRTGNQGGNYGNFNGFSNQPSQSGHNYQSQPNQYQSDRQVNNQGFNHGNNQSTASSYGNQGNVHNQAGGLGNNNRGNPPNSWNNTSSSNNNQFGSGPGSYRGNQGGGNNNFSSGNGGNRGGGNNNFGSSSGRGQFNQFNDKRNFQSSNFGNERGGFNGRGKRVNNVQDSGGFNDRQKRQRNNYYNR